MVIVNPIVSIWLSVWLFGEYFTDDDGVIALAACAFVALSAGAVFMTRTSPRLDEPVTGSGAARRAEVSGRLHPRSRPAPSPDGR